ncbi:hypothetical protein GPECTOR_4g983 [Gonium pectorale]|uniref:Uncharacterized protein n=1 Tax=Gonium pectorale TaxID=33097 RepID=A0A150GYJ8_GONPE|nr:hypothetical protein GPECTOR_4g983 [Gonium pectorale]|eukprot:KXZ54911.1 hypothetical protein GPECTOR_4g983 [Gonium pectorale]
MWDYEGSLGLEERRKIQGALLREVGRMYRQNKAQQPSESAGARGKPGWEEAFAQVMTAQQQTTAALLDLLSQCQTAIDELLMGMAVAHGAADGMNRAEASQLSSSGAAGSGASESRVARERLLRDAQADTERNRQMRQERENVLVEFRTMWWSVCSFVSREL